MRSTVFVESLPAQTAANTLPLAHGRIPGTFPAAGIVEFSQATGGDFLQFRFSHFSALHLRTTTSLRVTSQSPEFPLPLRNERTTGNHTYRQASHYSH